MRFLNPIRPVDRSETTPSRKWLMMVGSHVRRSDRDLLCMYVHSWKTNIRENRSELPFLTLLSVAVAVAAAKSTQTQFKPFLNPIST